MKYNPKIHNRKSIRLKGYDYSSPGLYFITICCQNRICRFGSIENEEMNMNRFGQIACDEWVKLPERFPNAKLGVFQIMPNHMHGIIILDEFVGAGVNPAPHVTPTQNDNIQNQPINQQSNTNEGQPQGCAPTVGDIVGAYKSLVATECLKIYKSENIMMGKLWQRNYWENIIRDESSNTRITNYIINNPKNWDKDKFFGE